MSVVVNHMVRFFNPCEIMIRVKDNSILILWKEW